MRVRSVSVFPKKPDFLAHEKYLSLVAETARRSSSPEIMAINANRPKNPKAFPKPVFFGNTIPPTPPSSRITDGVRLRNLNLSPTFTNDAGVTYKAREIFDFILKNYREFREKPGVSGYYYGQSNTARCYTSMFWWGLDTQLGFRTPATLDPLINYLIESYIISNFSDDLARPRYALTKEALRTYKELNLSLEAKEKIEKMQSRFGVGDLDSGKAQEYVESLTSLPWGIETDDQIDLDRAKNIFESRFYGLESIKQKILLKIAARQLKGKNRGGIILLVGAGGTGKTAIAETIAEALGRSYERISLAGVSDANDLLGFLYTYQGSKPGSVIESMRKAGSLNPVIQIDEMDKVPRQAGPGGNPRDALLAILDPDQNSRFTDRYLGVPFDLSRVLFICTANSIQDFPEHLLSRTDVIQVPIYLEEEKVVIAQKFLIPKHLKALNLPLNKVIFDDEAVRRVIRSYTREGGVRKLSARLAELLENASELYLRQPPAMRNSIAPVNQIRITTKQVDAWLSNPIPEPGTVQATTKVGSVNGLYYSVIGGGVIPIKAKVLPGSGQLILTGNLGKVMQESARVALSYILSNAQTLEVSQERVTQIAQRQADIHIQYLDSASEKDGPSAGVSTFLALYSAITNKPIPQNVGLTGEISLDGDILPVGGMLEKISGAFYQGCKTVFIPKENEIIVKQEAQRSKAFASILKQLNVQYVSTVAELLQRLNLLTVSPQPS